MYHKRLATICALTVLVFFAANSTALAHVKWFSEIDWSMPPLTMDGVMTPTFWAMFILSLVTLVACVLLDKWASEFPLMKQVGVWFESYRDSSVLVMRVAAFATLLVAWQQGTLLTPELKVDSIWVERFQLLTLILLLFPQTTSLAGLGYLGLWAYGASTFGVFHMLDYVSVLGFAYYLITRPLKNSFWRETALPALYFSLGFSLLWLGCEKLVYPQWAYYLLDQNPILTLGLSKEFFLVSAAFIEIGLGYLLMICLLSRSLSVTITLTFFLTTCVFGKVEIIGHTLVHASLIVFLFEGHGHRFTPPALFHKQLPMRIAFAVVNFSILVFAGLYAYTTTAANAELPAMAHQHPQQEVADPANAPTLEIQLTQDSMSGWNLQLITSNFRFAPEIVGEIHVEGEGHAHLYLDGKKIARLYGPWYHLPELKAGEHKIRVTLNTNSHGDYALEGTVIDAKATLAIE